MSSKVYRRTSERTSSVLYRIRSRSLCQACGKHGGGARYSTEEYAFLCARCYQQPLCSSSSSLPDRKGVASLFDSTKARGGAAAGSVGGSPSSKKTRR